MKEGITVTISYEVKGLSYDLIGDVVVGAPSEAHVIQTVEDTTDKLKSDYVGHAVEITRVHTL